VPPPGDADYPVPEFPDSELEEVKSAEYFEQVIAPWEKRFGDREYLRGVTLGQLGSDLEFTIHGALHLRWAAPSQVGYRPSTMIEGKIGPEWDAPAYAFLGDTYSSPVNPLFWKIHGWVDGRVEEWMREHRITSDIERKGAWVGPEAPASRHEAPDDYERIDRIVSASADGGFDGFFRPPARPFNKRHPFRAGEYGG
jgi:hypothetical protein